MKKLSVITPAFNAQKTIAGTIESVLQQSFLNFEYIIINHGSTDETGDIISYYAKKDSRIKLVEVKENTGFIGKAVNLGIEYATTDYVTFLDADDKYYPDYLKTQYENITSDNYDISITGSSRINEDNIVFLIDDIPNEVAIKNDCDYKNIPQYINTFPTRYFTVWWNKLYKLQFIKNNCLFFLEDTLIHGDAIFNLNLLLKRPKIYCSNYIGVQWFQRNKSVSFGTYKPEYAKEIMGVCSKYFEIFESFNANNSENEMLAKKLLKTVATPKRLKHYSSNDKILLAEVDNWKSYDVFGKLLQISKIPLNDFFNAELFDKLNK